MLTSVRAALQRLRVPLSFIFGAITMLVAQPTVRLILIGGAISLLGVGLRAWASGHLRKNEALTVVGPYAYTCNPLYLGSFLIGLGVMLASGSFALVIAFLILFAAIFSSAMIGEAGHLRKLFPEQYSQYERAVPLFFPRLTPHKSEASGCQYSFKLYKTHREYRVALGVAIILALLLLKAQWASAYPVVAFDQNQVNGDTAARTLVHPLPFAEGEAFTYEVRYSKLFISGKIGRLSFTFDRSVEKPLTDHYLIKAVAVSDGFLTRLFGINAHYVFESFVDKNDFGVARTRKTLEEGRKKTFELAVFDEAKGEVLYIERDLTKATAAPEVKQAGTKRWVQDIVSALYYVRAQPLAVGQTITFPLSDSAKTYDVDVKIVSQEEIKTGLGTFDTLKVQPLIFGQGRLIRKDGEMYVWLTNDACHLPIRAWVHGSFGIVNIELKDLKTQDPRPKT